MNDGHAYARDPPARSTPRARSPPAIARAPRRAGPRPSLTGRATARTTPTSATADPTEMSKLRRDDEHHGADRGQRRDRCLQRQQGQVALATGRCPSVETWKHDPDDGNDEQQRVVAQVTRRAEPLHRADAAPAAEPAAGARLVTSPSLAGRSARAVPPRVDVGRRRARRTIRPRAHDVDALAHARSAPRPPTRPAGSLGRRAARSLIRRWISARAPTSTPRVGSSSSSTRDPAVSQRATCTFCWLPPLTASRRASPAEGARIPSAVDVATPDGGPLALDVEDAPVDQRPRVASTMLSAIGLVVPSRVSRRSWDISARPAATPSTGDLSSTHRRRPRGPSPSTGPGHDPKIAWASASAARPDAGRTDPTISPCRTVRRRVLDAQAVGLVRIAHVEAVDRRGRCRPGSAIRDEPSSGRSAPIISVDDLVAAWSRPFDGRRGSDRRA